MSVTYRCRDLTLVVIHLVLSNTVIIHQLLPPHQAVIFQEATPAICKSVYQSEFKSLSSTMSVSS